jgi:hypothetical protein
LGWTCLFAGGAGTASAQATRDPQTELRRSGSEQKQFERNIDAARRSRDLRFIEGRRVTYQ